MKPAKSSAKKPVETSLVVPKDAMVQPPVPDFGAINGTMAGYGVTGAAPGGNRMRQWNRWRERYNPLRGLNIARAVTLVEQYQRGEMADPQWAYFFIEQTDPDLFALVDRRTSALEQLDWNIKQVSDETGETSKTDEKLAKDQAEALREAYEAIDNLDDAITHMAMATFRGFAHCEKYRNPDGSIYHLACVDQWNMVRDLLRGQWKYNPQANPVTFYALPPENLVDPADFIIRERDRHINRIALLKFIRANLCDKDWDAFIEIYGIPSGVVIGPPGVQPEKEAEFRQAAQNIAEGGSGYLPNGSTYTPNDVPRAVAPFRPRLDYLSEKLILAGTGGFLTMLAQSGSGTLAGNAHMEAFEILARAEAKKISGIFQRSLDAEILNRAFPGKPKLAYWELAANDEQDPGQIAEHALKFHQAGYRISPEELSEKSGYQLADAQDDPENNEDPADPADPSDPADLEKEEKAARETIANRLQELARLPEQDLGKAVETFLQTELPVLCNRAHPEDQAASQALFARVAGKLQ